MALKDDIVKFLRTDPTIARVNFKMHGFLVYPQAYSVDVAGLIDRGTIFVKSTSVQNEDAAASYYMDYNQIWVRVGFSVTDADDCSILVHEATHAHMDYKKVGLKPVEWSESIAYVAEAMYREARKLPPLSTHFLRLKAHSLAKRMLATGQYEVSANDATGMLMSAKNEPHYLKKAMGGEYALPKPFVNFDGF